MPGKEDPIRGERSEMKVALDLNDNGCRVAYPHGHEQQYDLISDKDDLLKIQVKTAEHERKRKYAIKLDGPDKYDSGGVDLFAGYVFEEDEVFYVPYEKMGKRTAVTFTPPEEMGSEVNRERAHFAADYTFEEARKSREQ